MPMTGCYSIEQQNAPHKDGQLSLLGMGLRSSRLKDPPHFLTQGGGVRFREPFANGERVTLQVAPPPPAPLHKLKEPSPETAIGRCLHRFLPVKQELIFE